MEHTPEAPLAYPVGHAAHDAEEALPVDAVVYCEEQAVHVPEVP